jgi:hypothetical protein
MWSDVCVAVSSLTSQGVEVEVGLKYIGLRIRIKESWEHEGQ